jgi:hypothetical protein
VRSRSRITTRSRTFFCALLRDEIYAALHEGGVQSWAAR